MTTRLTLAKLEAHLVLLKRLSLGIDWSTRITAPISCSRCTRSGESRRDFSSQQRAPSKPNYLNVFDRNTKLIQRRRAAEAVNNLTADKKAGEGNGIYDYIKDEVGFIMADRVIDIKRDINRVLDLGCGRGHVTKNLNSGTVQSVVATDICQEWLHQMEVPEDVTCEKLVMDEENIPFQANTFDMIISSLSLHWVNNLPKAFFNIQRCLKPDGVFLGAMFGGQSLYELRCSIQLAELEREGGMGSHISPFAEIQDVGGLLSINGFTMLTIDTQEIKVGYPSVFELMEDLKGMAENNASWRRKMRINRDTLFATGAVYKELYGNEDGSIPATFQIIYMIAWKPDPSQPKPLPQQKPDVSLKDIHKYR